MDEQQLATIEAAHAPLEGPTWQRSWCYARDRLSPCDVTALAAEVRRLRRQLEQPFAEGIVERRHGGVVLRGELDELLGWLADA